MTGRYKVVCVEDEQTISRLLAESLIPVGIDVVCTTMVDDGLAAVREHNPDLIVLDLMLPVRSGWELVDELRGDERYADLPIIVYTSSEMADEKLHGGRLDQVQEFVTKPRSILELRELIQKYLD